MPKAKDQKSDAGITDKLEKMVVIRPRQRGAGQLISRLVAYESATSRTSGTLPRLFLTLNAAERDHQMALLIADYIRLSAANMGKTPVYFDMSLKAFCKKLCDMSVPSHELMGTYLAAMETISEHSRYRSLPGLEESAHRTMLTVLQTCVDILEARPRRSAAA